MNNVIQLIMAFTGSLGFAGIFNIKKYKLLPAAIGGLLSWSIYLMMHIVTDNNALCSFVAAFSFTIYAEIMARLKKTPATLFLVPAGIPLLPGSSLYAAMRYAIQGQQALCLQRGIYTFLLAGAIACGILCAMTLWTILQKIYGTLIFKKN